MRKVPSAPAPAATPTAATQLPLMAGNVYISESTGQQLQKLGWQPGQQLPPNLGEKIAQLRKEFDDEMAEATRTQKSTDPKTLSTDVVDISTLPEAAQAELRRAIQEYNNPATTTPQSTPGLSIVNDLASRLPPAGIKLPPGKTFGGWVGKPLIMPPTQETAPSPQPSPPQPAPQPMSQPTLSPATESAANDKTEPASNSALPPPTYCPRCLFDTRQEFAVDSSPEDEKRFLLQVWFSSQRYTKDVPLFGGNGSVRFRSLLVAEEHAIRAVLGREVRTGNILGDAEFLLREWDLRFPLLLESVTMGGHPVLQNPELSQFLQQRAGQSLADFATWFYTEAIQQAAVRNSLGMLARGFDNHLKYLIAKVSDPDFCSGIDLRA